MVKKVHKSEDLFDNFWIISRSFNVLSMIQWLKEELFTRYFVWKIFSKKGKTQKKRRLDSPALRLRPWRRSSDRAATSGYVSWCVIVFPCGYIGKRGMTMIMMISFDPRWTAPRSFLSVMVDDFDLENTRGKGEEVSSRCGAILIIVRKYNLESL